jgi:hypothetical protein
MTDELKESHLKFQRFNCAKVRLFPLSIEPGSGTASHCAYLSMSVHAWQSKGEWNDMASLFMNGMEAATHQLWHNNAHFSKVRPILCTHYSLCWPLC